MVSVKKLELICNCGLGVPKRVQQPHLLHYFFVYGGAGGHDAHAVVVLAGGHLEAVQAADYAEQHLESTAVREAIVLALVHKYYSHTSLR